MVKKVKALAINKKNVLSELGKEIDAENAIKLKGFVKDKMKQIKKTEILLDKLNKELDDILSGKKTFDEEEIWFND